MRAESATDRAIFVRRYFYTEPLSAIANRLDMTTGGVKSRLHRLRTRLRAHLEKEGFSI